MFEELQRLAGDCPLSPCTGPNGRQLIRLDLPAGLHLVATPEYVLTRLQGGLLNDVRRLVEDAQYRGLSLLPAPWAGLDVAYQCTGADGSLVFHKLVKGPAERAREELSTLMKQASDCAMEFLSERKLASETIYQFRLEDASLFEGPQPKLKAFVADLQRARREASRAAAEFARLDALASDFDMQFLSSNAGAEGTTYRYRLEEGDFFEGSLKQLKAFIKARTNARHDAIHVAKEFEWLKSLAERGGMRFLRAVEAEEVARYEFQMDDGSVFSGTHAELKIVVGSRTHARRMAQKTEKEIEVLFARASNCDMHHVATTERDGVAHYIFRLNEGPTFEGTLAELQLFVVERSRARRDAERALARLSNLMAVARASGMQHLATVEKAGVLHYRFRLGNGSIFEGAQDELEEFIEMRNKARRNATRLAGLQLARLRKLARHSGMQFLSSEEREGVIVHECRLEEDGSIIRASMEKMLALIKSRSRARRVASLNASRAERERARQNERDAARATRQLDRIFASARKAGMHFLVSKQTSGGITVHSFTMDDGSHFEGTQDELKLFAEKRLLASDKQRNKTVGRLVFRRREDKNQKKLQRLSQRGSECEPGYRLLSRRWSGWRARYRWAAQNGRVVHASLDKLKVESRKISMRVLWDVPVDRTRDYPIAWTLPDGRQVVAPWDEFEKALAVVLGADRCLVPITLGFSAKILQALRNVKAV